MIPLYNNEAEIATLGGIFNNPHQLMELKEIVAPHCFYDHKHQVLYEAMLSLLENNRNIDLLTIINYLETYNLLNEAGGKEYITDIATNIGITTNIFEYGKIIYEKYILRKTKECGQKIVNNIETFKNIDDVIEQSEKDMINLSQMIQSSEFLNWKESVDNWYEELQAMLDNKNDVAGLKTKYGILDNYTNGFQKGEFIILAARPSMGKTAFSLNLALNIAKCSNNYEPHIAFFSLEMPAQQLITRLVAIEAGVSISNIRKARLSDTDLCSVTNAISNLKNYHFHLDETGGISIRELKSKARRLKIENKLDMIIIDYLQLISTDARDLGRVQEVSLISRELKSLAKELDIPIIALSQLSRQVESRTNKKPLMSDLRDSGAIEQDADIIMMLYRPEYYGSETETVSEYEGQTILCVEKNRNGATGDIEFKFFSESNAFIQTELNY